jgi:PhoH-like ATPase
MPRKPKKIFILDTNVLLHDFNCIYNFEENDIVIPITVLEELDKFKKGNDLINFHAREFTRELDKLSGDNLLMEVFHWERDWENLVSKQENLSRIN